LAAAEPKHLLINSYLNLNTNRKTVTGLLLRWTPFVKNRAKIQKPETHRNAGNIVSTQEAGACCTRPCGAILLKKQAFYYEKIRNKYDFVEVTFEISNDIHKKKQISCKQKLLIFN
jgi:hypothetical protein